MRKGLVFVFVLALAIRLSYIYNTSQGAGELHSDALGYHDFASHLIDEGVFRTNGNHRASRMPGYPIFLAGVYLLFGKSVISVQLAQAVLSSLSCVLLVLCARSLLPAPWALLAGFIGAVQYNMITGNARILSETVYIFMISLFLSIYLNIENSTRMRTFLAGILVGVTAMVRPEAVAFGLLFGFFLIKKPYSQSLKKISIFLLGLSFVMGPWVIRNYLIFNKIVLTTSRSGYGLYVRVQRHLVNLGRAPRESLNDVSDDEIENDKLFLEKAKVLHREMSVGKLVKLWLFSMAILFYPFHPFYDWTLVVFLPFWVYGAWMVLRQRIQKGMALVACVLGSLFVYTIFEATASRYQEPYSPVVAILSAVGIYFLYRVLHPDRFRFVMSSWLVFNGCMWLVSPLIRKFLVHLVSI